MENGLCPTCNKQFVKKAPNQIYCSQSCRPVGSQRLEGILKGNVGALSELLISADLFKRGYSVFRSLSPNAPCDLIILKNNHLLKVEVKTTYHSLYTNKITTPFKANRKFDVLALVVIKKNLIIYKPELKEV